MLLKALRFVSLVCAALAFGLTLTHDLEIPGKQQLTGAEWLMVQKTFYGGFAVVGGISEIGGLLTTGFSLYLLRGRRIAFALTGVAALSFLGMLAIFFFGNNPLNQQIATWTPDTMPANWQATRNAWDTYHSMSSVLAGVALVALLLALLRDTRPSALQPAFSSPIRRGGS
ncbi:MAG TPA: hypothetical protein VFD70_16635 [Anaerolineae bacterium]|nr:hypothetical protein [Anaerolineae bacterium]